MEFGEFSELSVQFLDDGLGVDQILVVLLAQGFSPRRVCQFFSLVIFHSQSIDFSLEVGLGFSLDAVGGIGEYSIVLIGADE